MADPGEGPGGEAGPPPLFLDHTEARRAEKSFFGDRSPPYLRVWMTGLPPPLISRSGSGTEFGPYTTTSSFGYFFRKVCRWHWNSRRWRRWKEKSWIRIRVSEGRRKRRIGQQKKWSFRQINSSNNNNSTWSYKNQVSKHFVISLNFPCLRACLLSCLLISFFLFVLWLGLCEDMAVDRISPISIFPPPFTSPLPQFSLQHKW